MPYFAVPFTLNGMSSCGDRWPISRVLIRPSSRRSLSVHPVENAFSVRYYLPDLTISAKLTALPEVFEDTRELLTTTSDTGPR